MSEPRSSKSFLQTLYFRLLVGIVAGVVVDRFFPSFVISRWEGQFNVERARAVLDGRPTAVEDDITLREHAGVT